LILIFWEYVHDVEVVLCPKFELNRSSFGRISNPGAFFGSSFSAVRGAIGPTGGAPVQPVEPGFALIFSLFCAVRVAVCFRLDFLLPHLLKQVPSKVPKCSSSPIATFT
jgi:hypothetical protein